MATITVHPEHAEGLRYLLDIRFEAACEEVHRDRIRELLAVGDQLGWEEDDPTPDEIDVPSSLLEALVKEAWEFGNEALGHWHMHRANPERGLVIDPERREQEARSMLAFYEHMQGQEVAS